MSNNAVFLNTGATTITVGDGLIGTGSGGDPVVVEVDGSTIETTNGALNVVDPLTIGSAVLNSASGDFNGAPTSLAIEVNPNADWGLVMRDTTGTAEHQDSFIWPSGASLVFQHQDGNGGYTSSLQLSHDSTISSQDMIFEHDKAIKTAPEFGHSLFFRASNDETYPGNWLTFITLAAAATPVCTIAQPSGGTLALIPPTTDPHVVGAIWNNLGVLAISAG
jgi:hypothetical protein